MRSLHVPLTRAGMSSPMHDRMPPLVHAGLRNRRLDALARTLARLGGAAPAVAASPPPPAQPPRHRQRSLHVRSPPIRAHPRLLLLPDDRRSFTPRSSRVSLHWVVKRIGITCVTRAVRPHPTPSSYISASHISASHISASHISASHISACRRSPQLPILPRMPCCNGQRCSYLTIAPITAAEQSSEQDLRRC